MVFFLIPLIVIIVSIVGGYLLSQNFNIFHLQNTTIPTGNDTISQLANTSATAAANFPVNDFIDMVWGGTFGVLIWLAKMIVSFATWAMRIVDPSMSPVPDIFGYIILAFLVVIILWTKWQWIWGFVANKTIIFLIILGAIIIIGFVMKYAGMIG